MNNKRRVQLKKANALMAEAHDKVEAAYDMVCNCRDEEQDAYDNLPESLQDSDTGYDIEGYVTMLEDISDMIDSLLEEMNDVVNGLSEVYE